MPEIATVAGVLGDPTRARMLAALMDCAKTATELALEGGVTPSTASSHLARLTSAELVSITRQGRHRYFRIATPEVAAAVEGLMNISARRGPRAGAPGPRDEDLRHARVCYDHLAGAVGVRLLESLRAAVLVAGGGETMGLTRDGDRWCSRVGIDIAALQAKRRRLCRECLDWSERRSHLAGALGAALLDRLFALRYARREPGGRAVILSPGGKSFLERLEVSRGRRAATWSD